MLSLTAFILPQCSSARPEYDASADVFSRVEDHGVRVVSSQASIVELRLSNGHMPSECAAGDVQLRLYLCEQQAGTPSCSYRRSHATRVSRRRCTSAPEYVRAVGKHPRVLLYLCERYRRAPSCRPSASVIRRAIEPQAMYWCGCMCESSRRAPPSCASAAANATRVSRRRVRLYVREQQAYTIGLRLSGGHMRGE